MPDPEYARRLRDQLRAAEEARRRDWTQQTLWKYLGLERHELAADVRRIADLHQAGRGPFSVPAPLPLTPPCRLPECEIPALIDNKGDGYCAPHYANLRSWLDHRATSSPARPQSAASSHPAT